MLFISLVMPSATTPLLPEDYCYILAVLVFLSNTKYFYDIKLDRFNYLGKNGLLNSWLNSFEQRFKKEDCAVGGRGDCDWLGFSELVGIFFLDVLGRSSTISTKN